jgi:hypothetical protein
MSDVEKITMLDEDAVNALGRVRVESWSANYDLKTDSFIVEVRWQVYGYGQRIPTASVGSIIAMFEAASRAGAAVYYEGSGGNLKWSIEYVKV